MPIAFSYSPSSPQAPDHKPEFSDLRPSEILSRTLQSKAFIPYTMSFKPYVLAPTTGIPRNAYGVEQFALRAARLTVPLLLTTGRNDGKGFFTTHLLPSITLGRFFPAIKLDTFN